MNAFFSPRRSLVSAAAMLMILSPIARLDAQVTFTTLDTPIFHGAGLDVSDDGTVVLGHGPEGVFLWTEATGAVTVSTLTDVVGKIYLSGDGTTVAGTDSSSRA